MILSIEKHLPDFSWSNVLDSPFNPSSSLVIWRSTQAALSNKQNSIMKEENVSKIFQTANRSYRFVHEMLVGKESVTNPKNRRLPKSTLVNGLNPGVSVVRVVWSSRTTLTRTITLHELRVHWYMFIHLGWGRKSGVCSALSKETTWTTDPQKFWSKDCLIKSIAN